MRAFLGVLGAGIVAVAISCTSPDTGANPLGCQPGCDAGDLCCPWSAETCVHDAGCGPKSGYICVGVDPNGICPGLQFAGLGDGG